MRLPQKLFASAVLFLLFVTPLVQVKAQIFDRVLWVTWRAATYLPPGYAGRAMPIPDTKIIGALDLIENGKVIDLSKETVYCM